MTTRVKVDSEHTYVVNMSGVQFICTQEEVLSLFGRIPKEEEEFEFKKTDGRRWNLPQYGSYHYELFLGQYGDKDFYLGKTQGIYCLMFVKEHKSSPEFMYLPDGSDVTNCKTWADEDPTDDYAESFRRAYEDALAANKLPEHPRRDKPKEAHTFLGWVDCYNNDKIYDAWANDDTMFLVSMTGGISRSNLCGMHSSMWAAAFEKAKEKGILTKVREKEINEEIENLQRKIDLLEQERALL